MRRLSSLQILTGAALSLLCLCLGSCSTGKEPHSQSSPDIVKLTGFWQPQLLYILPSPYSRLYVEVDAVEGCQPSDAALNKLHDFLTIYCQKPDGIEIVRGDVIPAGIARGVSLPALARRYLDGPPQNSTPTQPAYLYVLYCNAALSDKALLTDHEPSSPKTTARKERTPRNPHVDSLPYPPVIYINPRYGPVAVQNDFLLHEAGHELGLAARTNHASDYHCLNPTCLMNATITYHFGRRLLGMDPVNQHHLCPVCVAQLRDSAKQSPPSNLRFVGPVLVRSETDYHVLSLPDRIKVIAGELTAQDCRDFASAVHAEKTPLEKNDTQLNWLVKDEVGGKAPNISELLAQTKNDPLEPVRLTAPSNLGQFCVSHGQFTNAVNICREAIASNPKDDWSYNLLAWIKATCPNSSVRDGKEAISAATKACELTGWKQWSWLDTLAAAYAESGDFQHAIQFQEQALHGEGVPKSELLALQERLALYKQSQPYREKP